MEFFPEFSRTWNLLKNEFGLGKSCKFTINKIRKVLENEK